jgi:hypothetical protein
MPERFTFLRFPNEKSPRPITKYYANSKPKSQFEQQEKEIRINPLMKSVEGHQVDLHSARGQAREKS